MDEGSEIHFEDKLGYGAYGIVYGGTYQNKPVAIKRNIVCKGVIGIVSLKEADALSRLAGHPHIVRVEQMLFGSNRQIAFPKENINRLFSSGVKDDLIHFIFRQEATTLHSALKRKRLELRSVKMRCYTEAFSIR